MTINEAIAQANELRLNSLSDEIKVKWLADLDGQFLEMMEADADDSDLPAADEWPYINTWPETDDELLMPAPHDMVYVYYLIAQIDYYNQEAELYINDSAIYNAAANEARAWWRRNHPTKCAGNWRLSC